MAARALLARQARRDPPALLARIAPYLAPRARPARPGPRVRTARPAPLALPAPRGQLGQRVPMVQTAVSQARLVTLALLGPPGRRAPKALMVSMGLMGLLAQQAPPGPRGSRGMTVHRALPGRRAQQARPGWQELTAPRAASVQRDLQARRAHKALPGRRDRTDKPGQRAPRGHRARASPAQQGQLAPLDPGAIPARPDRQGRLQVLRSRSRPPAGTTARKPCQCRVCWRMRRRSLSSPCPPSLRRRRTTTPG